MGKKVHRGPLFFVTVQRQLPYPCYSYVEERFSIDEFPTHRVAIGIHRQVIEFDLQLFQLVLIGRSAPLKVAHKLIAQDIINAPANIGISGVQLIHKTLNWPSAVRLRISWISLGRCQGRIICQGRQ